MFECNAFAATVHEILSNNNLETDEKITEIEAILYPPKRPTMEDMTPEEREDCRWMQADVAGMSGRYAIIPVLGDGRAVLADECGGVIYQDYEQVTPRPDLPRMEFPGGKKSAPALPGEWRLADHPDYGRVIVTNPTPTRTGHVYFVSTTDWDDCTGFDWYHSHPQELTYIDTEPEEA